MPAGRRVLHERSNSKNNELPVFNMDATKVSQRDYFEPRDIATPLSPPNMPRRDTSGSSGSVKPPRTPNTPSSAVGSVVSFDSLPPVPPLQISKIPPLAIKKDQRGQYAPSTPSRLGGLQQFFQPPAQSTRPSIYVDTVARKVSRDNVRTGSSNSVDSGKAPSTASAPLLPPQRGTPSPRPIAHTPSPRTIASRSTPSPRPLPLEPRALIKRPSYIPPYTPEDYDYRRSSWVEKTLEQRYNYSRMNVRSLRMVGSDEEAFEVVEGYSTDYKGVHTTDSPLAIESPPVIRQKRSLISLLSRSGSVNRPGTATSQSQGPTVNLPTWAKFFYAGNASLPEEDEEDQSPPAPPNSAHTAISRPPSAVVRPRTAADYTEKNDRAEVESRWSYPHLDRNTYPISPVEKLKNRQLILFCLGFILPFCWIIGALLPLPGPRPMWRAPVVSGGGRDGYRVDIEATMNCTFEEERMFINHEYWRKVNRMMSAVGVVLTTAIIVLVVLAVKIA